MKKIIQVTLEGHPAVFQLDEAADVALQRYLAQAKARLRNVRDGEEILRDLERSIADKFAELPSGTRVISGEEAAAVLRQIGTVNTGESDTAQAFDAIPVGQRRLYRIKEGQAIAGVCKGLSAYSDVRVDWVRTIFLVGCLFTAGLPILIYVVLMFALPVVRTHEEYMAVINQQAFTL